MQDGTQVGSEKRTVVVVDDQAPMRRLILRMLAGRGYDLLEAADGASAIALAEQSRVDLLITDLVMPGMGGHELAAALTAKWRGCRVLYISGNLEHAGGPAGALPFLQKPFEPEELVEMVASLLGDRKEQSC
jgi:CheY-like chemotaxis protein